MVPAFQVPSADPADEHGVAADEVTAAAVEETYPPGRMTRCMDHLETVVTGLEDLAPVQVIGLHRLHLAGVRNARPFPLRSAVSTTLASSSWMYTSAPSSLESLAAPPT